MESSDSEVTEPDEFEYVNGSDTNPLMEERQSDQGNHIMDEEHSTMTERMMLMNMKGHQIEKLKSDNFQTWSTDIELILAEQDLWRAVSGGRKFEGKPNERDYTEQENATVYRVIYQSCDTERKKIIASTRNPKIAWDKICEIFEPRNLICRIQAVRNFFGVKMQEGEVMCTYINRVRELYREFINAGNGQIDDDLLAQVMIIGLPREYSQVKSITNTLRAQEITSKNVERILLSEYQQRKFDESEDNELENSKILVTKRNSGERKDVKREDRKCYTCGKLGHISKNCWRRIKPGNSSNDENKKKYDKPDYDKDREKPKYKAVATCL
jgi:hypothetical protein